MVVASSTRDSHSKKRFGRNIYHVIKAIRLVLANIDWRVDPFTQVPKASPQHRLVDFAIRVNTRVGQQIASNMLAHKLVIRHIGIECSNNVVAILIGVGGVCIELMSSRLGIANQI